MQSHRRTTRVAAVAGAAVLSALPALAGSAQAAPEDEPFTVHLATSDPAATMRIPAMTVTTSGTVLAAYDKRNGNAGDLPGDIDVLVRRSTDNGRTWEQPREAINYPAPQGCGDPSLTTDTDTGRIFLFCTFSHGNVGFADSQPGSADATDPNTLHIRVLTSDDDGATWSQPRDVTSQVKDKSWHGVFASSGHGIRTSAGRLIQPLVIKDAEGVVRSVNAYSDDHGQTWTAGTPLAPDTDENKAVELSDGRILQNSRNHAGGDRKLSLSEDGGLTFGAPEPMTGIPDPAVNADQIRVDPANDSDRRDWMLFSNPAHTENRQDLTLRLSSDNGATWPADVRLHSGPAGYSTVVMLPNGRVGVLAETGNADPYESIEFHSLSLDDVRTR